MICFVLGLLLCLNVAECLEHEKIEYAATNCRKHTAYLTDFGGVGDGKTSNTAAFVSAIANLSEVASDGGAQLIVPPGKWLTGSFSLISNHFTLYVDKKAVLIASQVIPCSSITGLMLLEKLYRSLMFVQMLECI